MKTDITSSLNLTTGKEYEISCIKCTGKTTHKVVTSTEIRGHTGDSHYDYYWSVDYQIIQCLGCKSISFRQEDSNSEDYYQIDEDEFEYGTVEKIYPSRVEGIKSLGNEKHYLPSNVRTIYDETLTALSNQSPILAAIGLRALLETVCKEKKAEGNDLFKKIDSLTAKKILTPAGAIILHKIRSLGNSAAHEVKPHSEKQLALAMDIIEHMLKEVYILPKQADTEFEDSL